MVDTVWPEGTIIKQNGDIVLPDYSYIVGEHEDCVDIFYTDIFIEEGCCLVIGKNCMLENVNVKESEAK